MNDNPTETVWPDRKLTENQERVRQAAELMPVARSGARPENFAQLVDYATWMSKAQAAVPDHLIRNVGACLAVIEIANKFGYPAYMIARQSYVVGGVLTFMGQFIMAVINDFCPIRERLKFRFEGEGPSLRVIVTGHFKSEVDPVEYTSPTFAEITVKNSPLWKVDPQQQFCYYGARRWQSRYWPEGLFGIYSPDEIEDTPELRHTGPDRARDVTGLASRLVGNALGEGFKDGHADAELSQIAPDVLRKPADTPANEPGGAVEPPKAPEPTPEAPVPPKRKGRPAKAKPEVVLPATAAECKTSDDYLAYAKAWIENAASREDAYARLDAERDVRDVLKVSIPARGQLEDAISLKWGSRP